MAFDVVFKFPKLPPQLRGRIPQRIIGEESRKAVARGSTEMLKSTRKARPSVSGVLRRSWKRIRIKRQGRSVVGGVMSDHWAAWYFERGRKPRPFPNVACGQGDPKLGPWLREGPVGSLFITEREKGTKKSEKKFVKVPADPSKRRHALKLAFTIGRAIKRRGLPSQQALGPSGGKRKVFSRAITKNRAKIRKQIEKIIPNIVARLGG